MNEDIIVLKMLTEILIQYRRAKQILDFKSLNIEFSINDVELARCSNYLTRKIKRSKYSNVL